MSNQKLEKRTNYIKPYPKLKDFISKKDYKCIYCFSPYEEDNGKIVETDVGFCSSKNGEIVYDTPRVFTEYNLNKDTEILASQESQMEDGSWHLCILFDLYDLESKHPMVHLTMHLTDKDRETIKNLAEELYILNKYKLLAKRGKYTDESSTDYSPPQAVEVLTDDIML